jgi:hypothetical protein
VNADAWFSLAVASIPVVGAVVGAVVFYGPVWLRKRRLRKLDQMFEYDREWWEAQFRDDMGRK